MTLTFEGKPHGDGDCFCWVVSEETYRRIVGEERYQFELECRQEYEDGGKNMMWLLYPNEFQPLQCGDLTKVPTFRYTVTVEEVK